MNKQKKNRQSIIGNLEYNATTFSDTNALDATEKHRKSKSEIRSTSFRQTERKKKQNKNKKSAEIDDYKKNKRIMKLAQVTSKFTLR